MAKALEVGTFVEQVPISTPFTYALTIPPDNVACKAYRVPAAAVNNGTVVFVPPVPTTRLTAPDCTIKNIMQSSVAGSTSMLPLAASLKPMYKLPDGVVGREGTFIVVLKFRV